MLFFLRITAPDAILNIGLQIAVGKMYLDGAFIHKHTLKCTNPLHMQKNKKKKKKKNPIAEKKHTMSAVKHLLLCCDSSSKCSTSQLKPGNDNIY